MTWVLCGVETDGPAPGLYSMVSFERVQTLSFSNPEVTMRQFAQWLAEQCRGRPYFISDIDAPSPLRGRFYGGK